jgi:hypothetical protein
MNESTTTREIRQALFQLPTPQADAVRRELFDVVDQDSAAPAELYMKAFKAVSDYNNTK